MPRIPLVVTNFQNSDGTPVVNGYLTIRLNVDGSVSDTQIQGGNNVKVPLDSSGVILGSPTFWPNSSLAPSGTYYILSVYSLQGQLVAGPIKLTV